MANKANILSPAPHKEVIPADQTETNHTHVIYYFDKKYKPVDKKKASIGIIHEYDDHGRSIHREYIQLQNGEVITSETPETFTDAEIVAELELLKEKRLSKKPKEKTQRQTQKQQTHKSPKDEKSTQPKNENSKNSKNKKPTSSQNRRPARHAATKDNNASNNKKNHSQNKNAHSDKANSTQGLRRRASRSVAKLPGMTEAHMPKTE